MTIENQTAVLAGLGTCLPVREVDNAELVERLGASDAWIRDRTGIAARRIAPADLSLADLAVAAGGNALKSAGVAKADAVVVATSTPERLLPAVGPQIASTLGLGHAAAFDVSAGCCGFVYALTVSAGLIATGLAETVLVVAPEKFSTVVDPTDRTTAVLFGDGAGAAVLRSGRRDEPGALLAVDWGSDGTARDLIRVPDRRDGYLSMTGKRVYLKAIEHMTSSTLRVLDRCGWATSEVDTIVPHQANMRIIRAVAQRLSVPESRTLCTLERTGNTGAAAVPLALTRGQADGVVGAGDRMVLTTFGAGLAWASAALVWPEITAVESEL
ncbi:beta-ketoacyl-ACP synthase 3 [Streptomyces fumanus]|uniref:3-oxoacyl-[acyl-carrier-protein] synthase 3 protein 5 n=1 Tax=Streptomyces fumanus TaxID=67302 RepID=A0A919ABR4_9ACTN|nr:beta-ketoacyl-ACP synthase 3 [Streptomyces fumanus]GHE94014.1 3-oxoacyl-[acyl-carrier-protein] synthase 3 protein 5 [Streptomyces fumanus]